MKTLFYYDHGLNVSYLILALFRKMIKNNKNVLFVCLVENKLKIED